MGLLIASIVLTLLTVLGVVIGRIIYYKNAYTLEHTDVEYYLPSYGQPTEEQIALAEAKALQASKRNRKEKISYFILTILFALSSFAWFLLLLFGCFAKVNANEVGIIYDDRYGVMETVKYEGFQSKSIFEHITTISTINRSSELKTTGQTNDGQYATFELSLIYRIDKDNAGKFYKVTSSDDISRDALNTLVKSSLQSSTIKYDIFELLSTELEVARLDFKSDLEEVLMEKYYVTLVDVSFDDIDAGKDVEAILQDKAEAQQRIEIAERQAQADLITAENKAEIEKTLADAEAYAIKTVGIANGEAESAYIDAVVGMIDNIYENMNGEMTYEECSQLVMSIVFYNTWNGELPEVLTSDSLSSLIGSLITNK